VVVLATRRSADARLAHDQLDRQDRGGRRRVRLVQHEQRCLDGCGAEADPVLADAGQSRGREPRVVAVVEADDGDILGNPQARFLDRLHRPDGHHVARREDGVGRLRQPERPARLGTRLVVEPAAAQQVLPAQVEADLGERALVAEPAFHRGGLRAPAAEVCDAPPADRGQVPDGHGGAGDVVGGHEACARPEQVRVDRDAGEVGARDRGELRLLGHERNQDDAFGPVGPAELEVVRGLAGDLAREAGEQEHVQTARVGAAADAEQHIVEERVLPALPGQAHLPGRQVHGDTDQPPAAGPVRVPLCKRQRPSRPLRALESRAGQDVVERPGGETLPGVCFHPPRFRP
jgi:hypothetical protein